jgi:hypothetical protein
MDKDPEYISLYDLISKDNHWVRVVPEDCEGQNEDKKERKVEGRTNQRISLKDLSKQASFSRSDEGRQMAKIYKSTTVRISSAKNLFFIRSLLIVIFVIILIGVYKLFNITSDR